MAGSFGDLCISSKSVLGLELQRSSVELLNEGRSSIEKVAPLDPYKDAEKNSDEEAKEKYSPIWSSINRKNNDSEDKKPVKIENCKQVILKNSSFLKEVYINLQSTSSYPGVTMFGVTAWANRSKIIED